jgi:hypothetical protein
MAHHAESIALRRLASASAKGDADRYATTKANVGLKRRRARVEAHRAPEAKILQRAAGTA